MSQHCERCRRAAPDEASGDFPYWEALGDGSALLCPGCITGAEQQAFDEEAMQVAEDTEFDEIARQLQ